MKEPITENDLRNSEDFIHYMLDTFDLFDNTADGKVKEKFERALKILSFSSYREGFSDGNSCPSDVWIGYDEYGEKKYDGC